MATSPDSFTEEIEGTSDALRAVLRHHVPPKTFPKVIKQKRSNLLNRLTAPQMKLILPSDNSYTGNYEDMDNALLYTLLRDICNITPHSNGWGNDPDPNDRSLSAKIERIRIAENQCTRSSNLSNAELNTVRSTIRSSVVDLDTYIKNINEDLPMTLEDVNIPPERFLANLKNSTSKVRHAHGIVVGCAGAGKTTLLYRLMGKSPEEIDKIKSTRGVHVHEHIFIVKNGDLLATKDDSLIKQLIRVPMSAIEKNEQICEDKPMNENVERDKRSNTRLRKNQSGMFAAKELNAMQSPVLAACENETNELARDVMKKILDAGENEISVSMFDFAGQFAYYACHQIYMRSDAFYILVLDMSKDFQDVVQRDTDEREGSIFSTWSNKNHLYFWLESIKTFGGTSPKIFAVATHAKSKRKEEQNCFWKTLWTLVPPEDKAWFRDCTGNKEFALELIEMNEKDENDLLSLKKSIADVLSQGKLDAEIEVPSAWALLEHLLKKEGKPILSMEDIKKVNEKIPKEYRLESQKEILNCLSFFHEHGILLFFNEQGLRDYAILGIQWFSNAFSKLIADKDHVRRDCQRRYIEEWKSYNDTGNLKDSLVDVLWEDKSYKDHKIELMSYMKRLRIIVSIKNTDGEIISWYVPCMNNKSFTRTVIDKKWEYSSVMSFRFKSFAMFIYYRLIAYCMSFQDWTVQVDKDNSKCLYQTAAVFETRNHTVLVGIIDNDIQLQVLRVGDLQHKDSRFIGKTIENALKKLTSTFERQTFQKGYKCLNIFCSEEDSTFIPENELSGIQCNCPLGNKHTIDVKWTVRFWKEMEESSKRGLQGRTRFAKLGMAIIDVLTETLRHVLEKEITSTDIHGKVNSTNLPKGVKGPNPEQKKLLVDAKRSGYKNFDITLLYMLIRNYCSKIHKPTNDWGLKALPKEGEITVGDDVERIRLIRNEVYGHVSLASVSQTEFDDYWSYISDICKRLETYTGNSYLSKLDGIQKLSLEKGRQEAVIKEIKVVSEHDKEMLEKIETMQDGISSIRMNTKFMREDIQELKAVTFGKKDEEESRRRRRCIIL